MGIAEQRDKSLNSLDNAASLHISVTKVCVNLIAGNTPVVKPGYLALKDSSIFLDKAGGSLEKNFSVVYGKYNLPDLMDNILNSSRNCHRFLVSSQVRRSRSLWALSCSSVDPL